MVKPQADDHEDIMMSLEDLAHAIEKMSDLGESIKKSRLSERALLILIKDLTGVKMSDIEHVLDALPRLKERYLAKIIHEQGKRK